MTLYNATAPGRDVGKALLCRAVATRLGPLAVHTIAGVRSELKIGRHSATECGDGRR